MTFNPTEQVQPPQQPGKFVLVGHGWRADFFLRIAQQAPQYFECVAAVTRGEAAGLALQKEWGMPTYRSIEDVVANHEIDVVVVCIPRAEAPAVITHLVELGLRVLTETPPAATLDGLLDLWSKVGESGLVCVAEQTPYVPIFAGAQEIVATGAIGEITSAALSWTHDYHAMAVLRGALGIRGESLKISAISTTEPLLDAANRRQGGFPLEITDHLHTRAFLQSESKTGLYDFVAGQWYQPLRQRRFLVRGTRGELDERSVVWSGEDGTPMNAQIERRQLGVNGNLEGADFDTLSWGDRVIYRNRFQGSRLSDDEIAVATCLTLSMQPGRIGGYSLADGSQDAYLALSVNAAVANKENVVTKVQPWSDQLDRDS
jgi:Oxidoreductase family, NAD-binding Rossmann fold